MNQPKVRNLNVAKLRSSGRGGSHDKRGKGRTRDDQRDRSRVRADLRRSNNGT